MHLFRETLESHYCFRLGTVARYSVTENFNQNMRSSWGNIRELILESHVLREVLQTASALLQGTFTPMPFQLFIS